MAKYIFNFTSDPGHGWIAVPAKLIKELGVRDKISRYSYFSHKTKMVFLEEDCDAEIVIMALEGKGHTVGCKEYSCRGLSKIRNMDSYDPNYIV